MSNPLRLNIGSGGLVLPGYIAYDIKHGHDMREPMPFPTGSVDEVYCSHALEHIHHSRVVGVLHEWRRVLKPNGLLRIAVPDAEKIAQAYNGGTIDTGMLNAWLYGGVDSAEDRHLGVFTEESLTMLLQSVGFDTIERFEPEHPDCSKLEKSLNLSARRRSFEIPKNPKICIVLSLPRLGFTNCFMSVTRLCSALGCPVVHWGTSGDWHEALTFGIEEGIKTGADYLLTIDYDSVFTVDDVQSLLKRLQENPDISVAFPVQAHRHRDRPLSFHPGVELEPGLTKLYSGHFGCSLIRSAIFKDLPHPWFMALPNPDTGRWTEGNKLAADISFWWSLNRFGHTICQDDEVQIGHMELCVKWVTASGIIWQPISHYEKKGRPPDAKMDRVQWEKKLAEKGQQVQTTGADGQIKQVKA